MSEPTNLSRRTFFKNSALGGAGLLIPYSFPEDETFNQNQRTYSIPIPETSNNPSPYALDLSPAKWIWFPSGRTLPNTFVLFVKKFTLAERPVSAQGWILGDSRYQLFVNNKRVQWGPPPSDPRWAEADPVDLVSFLQTGENSIAIQVVYFGLGDGTLPIGKPGLIFKLDVENQSGKKEQILSDSSWFCHIPRSWKPGHYKRWYLRSLQEEFDARLYPNNWKEVNFNPDGNWTAAMELKGPSNQPSMCTSYYDYMHDIGNDAENAELRKRSIPLLKEERIPIKKLSESASLKWKKSIEEYFEFLTPDAFEVDRSLNLATPKAGTWEVELKAERSAALTFEFDEQIVGWPFFTIEAAEGTTVELLVHEGHQIGGPALLNSHFNSWTRFICKQGVNHFEVFDFESSKWLQLHIHSGNGKVSISNIGIRRRIFPWQNLPKIALSNPVIQRLVSASLNTIYNCSQETIVDGMGRERQQYSGDVGHVLHALYHTFGEKRLPARYLNTFSQGMTMDGFFLDCWPAYDRLARLMERQLQLTKWGPLLDHGIGFNFDCYHHYMYTNDVEALNEVFPRLLKFFNYLVSILGADGLLPVENIGVPTVWMDHEAYKKQRHKQCSFNLYASGMCTHALAPLCNVMGKKDWQQKVEAFGKDLLSATIRTFWSEEQKLFIDNLPWVKEEKEIRYSDRALAMAILYNQIPGGNIERAVEALANCPLEMGYSYPANAGWRFWGLAEGGKINVVLKDLNDRWGKLDSVLLNNTLQEDWKVKPDSNSQWSHCPVVPLYILFTSVVGLRPLEPGFKKFELRPQPGSLEKIDLTSFIFSEGLTFQSEGVLGRRKIKLQLPKGYEGELVLDAKEKVALPEVSGKRATGLKRYKLPSGEVSLTLKFT